MEIYYYPFENDLKSSDEYTDICDLRKSDKRFKKELESFENAVKMLEKGIWTIEEELVQSGRVKRLYSICKGMVEFKYPKTRSKGGVMRAYAYLYNNSKSLIFIKFVIKDDDKQETYILNGVKERIKDLKKEGFV